MYRSKWAFITNVIEQAWWNLDISRKLSGPFEIGEKHPPIPEKFIIEFSNDELKTALKLMTFNLSRLQHLFLTQKLFTRVLKTQLLTKFRCGLDLIRFESPLTHEGKSFLSTLLKFENTWFYWKKLTKVMAFKFSPIWEYFLDLRQFLLGF